MKKIFLSIFLLVAINASAQTQAFVPKQDQALPNSYGMTVRYVTGTQEVFSLASHSYNRETNTIEFWTQDDVHNWIPMANVLRVEFDKNFSKIIAIKEKLAAEQKAKEQKNAPTPTP